MFSLLQRMLSFKLESCGLLSGYPVLCSTLSLLFMGRLLFSQYFTLAFLHIHISSSSYLHSVVPQLFLWCDCSISLCSAGVSQALSYRPHGRCAPVSRRHFPILNLLTYLVAPSLPPLLQEPQSLLVLFFKAGPHCSLVLLTPQHVGRR